MRVFTLIFLHLAMISGNIMTRGISGINMNFLPKRTQNFKRQSPKHLNYSINLNNNLNLNNNRKNPRNSGSINTGSIPGLNLEPNTFSSLGSIGDALSLLKPAHQSCSFYSPWTVGQCNSISQKVKKSYSAEDNLYVCLADGTFSPYQNCDENGLYCKTCVFLDTGLHIPDRLLKDFRKVELEGTRLCPAVYQDDQSNPCRSAKTEHFDCGPREWTELRY